MLSCVSSSSIMVPDASLCERLTLTRLDCIGVKFTYGGDTEMGLAPFVETCVFVYSMLELSATECKYLRL